MQSDMESLTSLIVGVGIANSSDTAAALSMSMNVGLVVLVQVCFTLYTVSNSKNRGMLWFKKESD